MTVVLVTNTVYRTGEDVDGEAFYELSSSGDIEGELQCKFTFGGKSKLKKLVASICTRPSGMLTKRIHNTLLLILLLLDAVTQRLRKLTLVKLFWDVRAHWNNLAIELNITAGDCQVAMCPCITDGIMRHTCVE